MPASPAPLDMAYALLDLLARLEVTIENDNFNINVELRREPAKDELEQLNRVVEGATAEFRHRMTSVKYAS